MACKGSGVRIPLPPPEVALQKPTTLIFSSESYFLPFKRSNALVYSSCEISPLANLVCSSYLSSMDRAVGIDGYVILATFSEDGPETCSGLPVRRYSVEELVSVVGPGFQLISSQREVHTTPWGAPQPFNWVVLRRNARS